ncbi:B3 domain-containing protein [Melia azedarach]|uniref:B3 domain-containing protein n=1 Tax=Melia azedarach TaxID=155640 RepID=A0ACC1WV96_MELAZ|nr:B3 domain-containing protein [Melia azedarach]
MGEACKECRSWEEEIYWNHFQCIHFIQYLHAGFDRQLAIPEKVARNLKKKLPLSVSLKGPSGFMWVVGITARDNTLYFCHGWPEFVKNHFLQENDILFFKYNGDSLFDVLMFDGQSKCEKAASYFVRKCGHTDHDGEYQTKRKIGENSVEVIPTSPHCDVGGASPEKTDDDDVNKTPVGQPVISQASSKRVRRVNSSVKAVHTRRSLRSKELCTSFVENEKAKPGAEPTSFIGDVASSPHYASNRRPVTDDEKKNAMLLAQAALTADSFTVVMRPTHVYRRFYMAIPAGWMTKHLTLENQDVILCLNEKTWVTRFQFCKPRCSGGLSGGWKNFAVDNNLDEFDVCVFNPDITGIKPVVLNVSIFRVVNDVSPLVQVAPASLKL